MVRSATGGWSGSLPLLPKGEWQRFLEFQLMFEGVEIPAKALVYGRTWPEAWTWMCDAFNTMARVDEKLT